MLKFPYKLNEEAERLGFELQRVVQFTCPCCSNVYESEEDETEEEFKKRLITVEKVRYVEMKYMQGFFCQECYSDPEIQHSTL